MSPSVVHAQSVASEAQLVERLRTGDEQAFLELVQRHQGSFRRLARGLATSDAIAEEIVQESWTAALEALPSFEGRSSVRTWLFRIVLNRARTRAEREGRSIPFSALAPEGEAESSEAESFAPDGHWGSPVRSWSDETPEALLLRGEVRLVMEQAIAALPPQQRVVLTLRDMEGCPSDEVCNVLNVSESNQRVLLHRARMRVRTAVAKYMEGEN